MNEDKSYSFMTVVTLVVLIASVCRGRFRWYGLGYVIGAIGALERAYREGTLSLDNIHREDSTNKPG